MFELGAFWEFAWDQVDGAVGAWLNVAVRFDVWVNAGDLGVSAGIAD